MTLVILCPLFHLTWLMNLRLVKQALEKWLFGIKCYINQQLSMLRLCKSHILYLLTSCFQVLVKYDLSFTTWWWVRYLFFWGTVYKLLETEAYLTLAETSGFDVTNNRRYLAVSPVSYLIPRLRNAAKMLIACYLGPVDMFVWRRLHR